MHGPHSLVTSCFPETGFKGILQNPEGDRAVGSGYWRGDETAMSSGDKWMRTQTVSNVKRDHGGLGDEAGGHKRP